MNAVDERAAKSRRIRRDMEILGDQLANVMVLASRLIEDGCQFRSDRNWSNGRLIVTLEFAQPSKLRDRGT